MRTPARGISHRATPSALGIATLVLGSALASAAWCASLINSGFEVPALASGYQYNPVATGIGWIFSARSGIEHNGSALNAATAPEGFQAAFVQMTGSLGQTLNLSAGSYMLSLKAAQRACCAAPNIQPIRVTLDGAQIGPLISPSSTVFSTFTIPFSIAATGAHTLVFTGTDTADKTTFIDAVTIASSAPAATTTALASSVNPSTAGTRVLFTATVTGTAPAGNVAFFADGLTLTGCGAIALPAGTTNTKTATCATTALTIGTHTVVARYGGDSGNQASASAAVSQVVNAAPSSLVNASFEAPALATGYRYNPTGTGVGWTFSGTSGIEHNGSALNAVTAPDGVQAAFVQKLGTMSQALTLGVGNYTLSFKAAQRACCVSPYAQSLRVTVDGVQIGALVSPSSTSFAAYSIPFSIATAGTHVIAITGTDPADKTSFIDAVTLSSAMQTTSTTGLASSLNPAPAAVRITFTATVNGSAPTGTVTFSADSATVAGCGAVALPSGGTNVKTAACSTSGLSAGTHRIVAVYPGDTANRSSTSAVLSQAVTSASQTIAFAPIPRQILGTGPLTLRATASSGLAVAFATLTPSICSVSGSVLTLLTTGACTVQATQSGNANYSAAAPVNQSCVVMGPADFDSVVTYAVGDRPEAIAVADFNADGMADIAVANSFSGSVSILLGRGDGSLSAGTTIQLGGNPSALAVADFNADGKPDLAVGDLSGNRVLIFAGQGDGTFAQSSIVSPVEAPIAIAAGDLNRDGKPDLAVVDGTYAAITGHTVSIALGNGDGSFRTPSSYPTGSSPYGVVAADFNGDGKLDLAVANGDDGTVSILIGHGDGTFAAAVSYAANFYPDALAVGDFNADGKPDLAVANDYSNDVSILLGRGDGTFSLAGNVPAGDGPASVAVGDFNGDGIADLAVANRFDSTVTILLGNADGTFQTPVAYSGFGTQLVYLAVSDLDNNGTPDLLIASAGSNSVSVLMNGATPVAPASLVVQSGGAQSASVGTAYPIPLAVVVKDPSGHALGGVSVTFSAPAAGASGVFSGAGNVAQATSGVAGVATAPRFMANGIAGSFAVVANAGSATASFALTNTAVMRQSPSFTSGPPLNGVINVPYNFAVSAGGAPPPSYSVSPSLPPGLAMDAATGLISGTPTQVGSFSGAFTASNGVAPDANQAFTIAIGGAPQAIAFAAPIDRGFGEQPFAVAATASSGLTVSLTSLTPSVCIADSSTVTIVAAGTCTVRGTQSGDATYAAAPAVDRSFVVTRGNQSITFPDVTGAVVDRALSLGASASSGLPIAFVALTPATCTVSGASASLLAVGICTIRASQAGNANYNPAPSVDQSFAVARSAQTITFWDPGMRRIAIPFPLDAISSSGLPVTFASLTPAICTVSGLNATGVATGTCTIRASQIGDPSYAATAEDRSFLISSSAAPPAPVATGPFIEYSTYLGSSGGDAVFDVVVGPDGNAHVGGSAAATDFLNSATFTNGGLDLLYVAKVAPAGQLDYATAIGGRAPDIRGTGTMPYVGAQQAGTAASLGGGQVEAMTADSAGNVYIAAYEHGTKLPVTGGMYVRAGPKSIFKLGATGAIQAITASIDPAVMTIRALAIDSAGALYFTGAAGPGLLTSASAAIRTMPAPSGPFWTMSAPYLIKLTPAGLTAFSTYLSVPGNRASAAPSAGQSLMDAATTGYALAVDAGGNSYVAGQATADQFPVTPGSPDTVDAKNRDAFVAKVNPTGTALLFVARLGGSDAERATGIALAPDGSIVIGGKTATQPFVAFSNAFQSVVTFAPQTPLLERETGFVAKLSPDGKQWIALAAVGSSGGSLVANWAPDAALYPIKVAVDRAGAIYAVGTTFVDRSLPTLVNLTDLDPVGAFAMKMTPDARKLIYSTTMGGGIATGLALDAFGNAFVAGYDNGGISTVGSRLSAATTGDAIPGAFVMKLNDALGPIALASDRNPAIAGQVLNLRATIADSRFTGSMEFDEGAQVIGNASVVAGSATLSTTLAAGIHRLRAVFHGDGPFDGYASPELWLVVAQP